jgi:hypothetical protein
MAASAQVDMSAPPSESRSQAPGAEAHRDPVITMFDNFSISGVVAGLCKPPDEATMGRFLRNLAVVQSATLTQLRQRMPDKSPQEIADVLKGRMQGLNNLATDAVQRKGCTDPEIAKLVEAFNYNASLDFSKQQR